MSVIKSRCVGMLLAVGLIALPLANAQDFDSLLEDLTLPSPTTLSASASAEATDTVAEAVEGATNADEFGFDDEGGAVETNAETAESVESAESAESAPAEPSLDSDDDFFGTTADTNEAADTADDDDFLTPPAVSSNEDASVAEAPASTATDDFFADSADEDIAAEPEVAAEDTTNFEETVEAPVAEEETPAVASEPEPAPVPMDDFFGAATPAATDETDTASASNDFDAFGDAADDEAAAADSESVASAATATAASAVPELSPDASGLDPKLVATQEEVRRQARENEGRQAAARGLTALKEGRYEEALKALAEAKEKVPERAATAALVAEINQGLGQAYVDKATATLDAGGLKASREALQAAKAAGMDVKALERRLTKAEERDAVLKSRPVPVKSRPEVIARKKTTEELMLEARQYFNVRDYNAAEALFERVLQQDEYNVDAMRFLRRIDEIRYKISTQEREATAARLVEKVRDGWNTPATGEAVAPAAVVNRGAVETQTSAQKLQEKMEKIVIPSIEFRQANITDVVNFLVEASIAGDPEKSGVNIILNLNIPGGGASSAAPTPAAAPAPMDDPFGFGGDFGDGGFAAPQSAPAQDFSSGSSGVPTITLNLRRISLLDAIKYITEVARLKYRLEENAVMITPEGVVSGRVVTRLYPVQPSILDVIVEKGDDGQQAQGGFQELGAKSTTFKKSDVKDFFEKTGVPFPAGTSITYNPTISQLIVANTPENLEVFERILARLNVIPNQVEIEARFVEISQDDLEELGFQWLLTDNWEIAQQTGPFGAASAQRVQMNADPDGLTQGLRFFGRNSTTASIEPATKGQFGANVANLGGIATFASVLTNPEVSLIIQALSQHGGTDLLSAPRVTTRSGVNAQIQVVREIIYPTEFEPTQPQFNDSGNVTTPPVVTPGTFEKRETGVILNVTPTVGPDGYTIDLVMVPEVSELVDWIQYGSTISLPRTDPLTGLFAGDQTFTFNMPQPIFSSRNVTTSIVIWDGQTVVMGGLIREDLVKIKDKIPGLGDIPLIGRLFRSEGEYSRKKNLLIFVTARLVDPAGKPLNRGESMANVDAGAAAPVAAP